MRNISKTNCLMRKRITSTIDSINMQKGDKSESSERGMDWMWWSPRIGGLTRLGRPVIVAALEAMAEGS